MVLHRTVKHNILQVSNILFNPFCTVVYLKEQLHEIFCYVLEKISQLCQVVQFDQLGQLGQLCQLVQFDQLGQLGQLGQFGQLGQHGQFNQLGQHGQIIVIEFFGD